MHMHRGVKVIRRDKDALWLVTVDCNRSHTATSWPALYYCSLSTRVPFCEIYFHSISNKKRRSDSLTHEEADLNLTDESEITRRKKVVLDAAIHDNLSCPTHKGKEMPLFSSQFIFFCMIYHFRTIMNCNLKVIQPRAFSQNSNLRYMWVKASLSLPAMFPCTLKGTAQTSNTWHSATRFWMN